MRIIKFFFIAALATGNSRDLMVQRLARRAEDREVPGFSPTKD